MLSAERFSIVLLIAVIFSCYASASLVSVVIQPEGRQELVTLYPYEVASYDIYIINNGSDSVENLTLVVSTDNELAIVIDGSEARERRFFIEELMPNEQKIESIEVKALQAGEKDFKIYVDYGFEELSYSVSTKVKIVGNPILINARLSRTAINPEDEASVVLDITNTSTYVLNNIVADLIVSTGLSSDAEQYRLESLDPNQSLTNKEFKFFADPVTIGKREVILRIRYSDNEGEHLIEKNFTVDVQNRTSYLFIIIIGIVVLVIISYMLRQKKEKPKIDTSNIEIEGIKNPPQTKEKKESEVKH